MIAVGPCLRAARAKSCAASEGDVQSLVEMMDRAVEVSERSRLALVPVLRAFGGNRTLALNRCGLA